MNKHRCKICAYIYDPAGNNNVPFKDLPDDYKCPVCGAAKDAFEVIHQMGEEYTGGEAQEKHVPVIEVIGSQVTIKIGSVPHPMEEGHHITHVELYNDGELLKKITFQPGQEPIVKFDEIGKNNNLMALAYCNLHGIWES